MVIGLSHTPSWSYWYNNIIDKYRRGQKFNFGSKFYIYRYIRSDSEIRFIKDTKIVFSTNPYGTYWTTLYTDDENEAQKLLALPGAPKYRIGGIPIDSINSGLIKNQGRVKPNNGQPGGAWEIVVSGPVMIVSLYNFRIRAYESL